MGSTKRLGCPSPTSILPPPRARVDIRVPAVPVPSPGAVSAARWAQKIRVQKGFWGVGAGEEQTAPGTQKNRGWQQSQAAWRCGGHRGDVGGPRCSQVWPRARARKTHSSSSLVLHLLLTAAQGWERGAE